MFLKSNSNEYYFFEPRVTKQVFLFAYHGAIQAFPLVWILKMVHYHRICRLFLLAAVLLLCVKNLFLTPTRSTKQTTTTATALAAAWQQEWKAASSRNAATVVKAENVSRAGKSVDGDMGIQPAALQQQTRPKAAAAATTTTT